MCQLPNAANKPPQNSVVQNNSIFIFSYFAQQSAIGVGFSRDGLLLLLPLAAKAAQRGAKGTIFKMADSHGWQVGATCLLGVSWGWEPWFLSPLAFPWTAWAFFQHGDWITRASYENMQKCVAFHALALDVIVSLLKYSVGQSSHNGL